MSDAPLLQRRVVPFAIAIEHVGQIVLVAVVEITHQQQVRHGRTPGGLRANCCTSRTAKPV